MFIVGAVAIPDDEWWYATGQDKHGPVSGDELYRLAQEGTITLTTLVWHRGQDEWTQVAQTPELQRLAEEL